MYAHIFNFVANTSFISSQSASTSFMELPPEILPIPSLDDTFCNSDTPSPSMLASNNDYRHSDYQSESQLLPEIYSSPNNYSSAAPSPYENDSGLAPPSHTALLSPTSHLGHSMPRDHSLSKDREVRPTRAARANKKKRKCTKHRANFPWEKKWEMRNMHESNPHMTQEDLAEKYGVERSTISIALKDMKTLLENGCRVGEK